MYVFFVTVITFMPIYNDLIFFGHNAKQDPFLHCHKEGANETVLEPWTSTWPTKHHSTDRPTN